MKHIRHPFFLLASALIIFAIIFKQSQFFTQKQQSLPQIEDLKSSWQLYQSAEWRMNKQKPTDQTFLIAEKIEAYEQKKLTWLHEPFLIRQTAENLYTLQAQQAKIDQQQAEHQIEFKTHVTLTSFLTTPPHNWQSRLTGEHIFYTNDTQQLKSQGPAQLEQPGLVISGNNLHANLQKQDFSFQQPVKTLYSPH